MGRVICCAHVMALQLEHLLACFIRILAMRPGHLFACLNLMLVLALLPEDSSAPLTCMLDLQSEYCFVPIACSQNIALFPSLARFGG